MAHQHDQEHEKQGCIQLIRCIPPTDEERNNPQYVPQLEINPQAQQIISERFEAPISIIVYAGNIGVGKSKLATVTVAVLEKKQHRADLPWFRSGAGAKGVTQGVWMWCEPLRHPDQDEQTKGSILILDCEGMDYLDENTAANLYFFCMIISTAFVVVLRPACIDRFQCDRLYHALRRFEVMKSFHVLPNVWLLPLDLPKFLHADHNTGDDIEISKEEWLHKTFNVNYEGNSSSSAHNEKLKERYEYIARTLPQIDTINIDYLPPTLMTNNRLFDVYTSLRTEESAEYFKSINTVIRALLRSGGKRLVNSDMGNSFIQPAELSDFMGELINTINQDTVPNPKKFIEQYLTKQFTEIIEQESLARFQYDLSQHAKVVIYETWKQLEAQMEEILRMDEKMQQHHSDLVRTYCDTMIRRARHEITRHDVSLASEFEDEEQRKNALLALPITIQDRLNIIDKEMKSYQKTVDVIDQARHIISENWRCWTDETRRLLEEAYYKLNENNDEDLHKNRENKTSMLDEPCMDELARCSEAKHSFFEKTPNENPTNASIDELLECV